MEKISLVEFYEALGWHDWFYEYSDDSRVWRSGSDARNKLQATSKQSPEHLALYEAYYEHIFSGPTWSTEKSQKPARPVSTEDLAEAA